MNFFKSLFKRPITICFIIIVSIVLGIVSSSSMAVNLLPNISFPYLGVITTYVGANAMEIENQVTLPLSQQLSSISSLNEIQSYSMDNASILVLQFDYGTNIDDKTNEVKENIDNASLPSECTYEITKVDLNATAVSTLSMYSTNEDFNQIYDDVISLQKQLLSINGVEKVDLIGLPEAQIKITPINNLEMSTLLIAQQLMAYDSNDIPLGEIIENEEYVSIKNESKLQNIDEIKNLTISLDLSNENIENLKNLQNILNTLSYINTNELDQIKSQTFSLNQMILLINNASDDELNQLSSLKSLITFCDNATIEELQNLLNYIPLLSFLNDEQLKQVATSYQISYDLIIYLKNNQEQALSFIQQLITLKQDNNQELTSTQYSQLIISLEIINNPLINENNLPDLIEFIRNVDSSILNQCIDTLLSKQELSNQQYIDLFSLNQDNIPIDFNIFIPLIKDKNYQYNFEIFYQYKNSHQQFDENNNIITQEISSTDYVALISKMKLENTSLAYLKITEKNIDFIKNIKFNNNQVIAKIQDIAEVNEVLELNTYSEFNQVYSCQLLIYSTSGANATEVVEKVEKIINEYNNTSDIGNIVMLDNQAKFINESLSNALSSLIIGGILAILVIYLFLRKIPSSLIIAVSMPLSILCTLVCLYLMGITLNMVSIGGLAVGIGMLVDNSIVVLESISSEREKGKNALDASIDGVKIVLSSLIGSTITSICVFFPILLMLGLTKEIFSDLAWSVIFSLSFSLLVAILIIPSLYCLVYRNDQYQKENKSSKVMNKLKSSYEKVLNKSLSHKLPILLVSFSIFISSIGLIFTSSIEFLPSIDDKKIELTVNFSSDYKFDECQNKALEAYHLVLENIDNIEYSALNVSKKGLIATNMSATISIKLNDKIKDTTMVVEVIREVFNQEYSLPVSIKEIDGVVATLTGGMAGISATIKGEDRNTLKEIANKVESEIINYKGIKNVTNDYSEDVTTLKIKFDNEKLTQYQIDYTILVNTLRVGISSLKIGNMNIEDKQYSIYLSFNSNFYEHYGSILNYIVSYDKNQIPILLKDVATIEEVIEPKVIKKINGINTLTITIETFGLDTNSASNTLNKVIKEKLKDYPGYSYVSSGVSYYLRDAFSGLVVALIIAFFLLFGIMACLFESLRKPIIIIMSFPFAFTGGFIALSISGTSLNVVSFIGLIMLMGVIVNEAIILIERYDQLEKSNIERRQAIIMGSLQRLRAVLMTTLTTVLALIPMALGLGKGGELMKPLGVIAIGGLTFGSIVTLIIIPLIYDLLMKKRKLKRSK